MLAFGDGAWRSQRERVGGEMLWLNVCIFYKVKSCMLLKKRISVRFGKTEPSTYKNRNRIFWNRFSTFSYRF